VGVTSPTAFRLPLQAGSPWHSGCGENMPYPQAFQINRSSHSVLAVSMPDSHRCKWLQWSRLSLICWVVMGLVGLNFVICPTQARCGWLAR